VKLSKYELIALAAMMIVLSKKNMPEKVKVERAFNAIYYEKIPVSDFDSFNQYEKNRKIQQKSSIRFLKLNNLIVRESDSQWSEKWKINNDVIAAFANIDVALEYFDEFKNKIGESGSIKKTAISIHSSETMQSITYRVFELAESAIKAAIAQAIEEQFND
jgi:hypothetical protein